MQISELIAGTTVNFLTAGGDYPASEGWVLSYRLVRRSGAGAITLTASAEGDDHRVQETAANTAAWVADTYSWASRVTKAGEVYEVDSGTIVVKPNIGTQTGTFDNRSQAQRALDDAKAAFADFSTSGGVKRKYRIGDREVEYSDKAQIVMAIDYWQKQVNDEARTQALLAGAPDPRKAYVRLNRE